MSLAEQPRARRFRKLPNVDDDEWEMLGVVAGGHIKLDVNVKRGYY